MTGDSSSRRRLLLAGFGALGAAPVRAQVPPLPPAGPARVAPPPAPPGPLPLAEYDFLAERRARPTRILRRGPAPQGWRNEPTPAGATRVTYRSAGRTFWGLLGMPRGPRGGQPVPALVYAHGGFAFANSEFEQLRPFIERGFAVFTPTVRAENGNPGFFEFMWGEVDDLAAATRRLAEEPGVDRDRIFVFGHSNGGGLSDLLALYPDVPVRSSGSAGGLYFPDDLAPDRSNPLFPPDDPWERQLRSMVPSARQLARRHLAILGAEEHWASQAGAINAQARLAAASLEVALVPGDHVSALPAALEMFMARVEGGAI